MHTYSFWLQQFNQLTQQMAGAVQHHAAYNRANRGAWPTHDDLFVSLSDVCQAWDSCKRGRARMMILIDSCFSGSWVSQPQRLQRSKTHCDVAIQTSCDAREISEGTEHGNFTQLWLALQHGEMQLESELLKHFKLCSLFHLQMHLQPSIANGKTCVLKTIAPPPLYFIKIGSMRLMTPTITRDQQTMHRFIRLG